MSKEATESVSETEGVQNFMERLMKTLAESRKGEMRTKLVTERWRKKRRRRKRRQMQQR